MATITPNHEAQMRPLALSVTSAHTLAFKGGEIHDTVSWPVSAAQDAAIQFESLSLAYDLQREAIGATAAILARVFPKAGAL